MKTKAILCECVDATDPSLPAYTKYVLMYGIRPHKVWLASLRQHEQLMKEFANVIIPKSHMLVKSSSRLFINYN